MSILEKKEFLSWEHVWWLEEHQGDQYCWSEPKEGEDGVMVTFSHHHDEAIVPSFNQRLV